MNNIKIAEKSNKHIFIYYIRYVMIIKDLKIYSVNPLYLIFIILTEYFEEINGNKYLTLVPTNKSKEKNKKYEGLWSEIRELIKSVTKKSDHYGEKYLKIKFDSDDELPLSKTIEIPIIRIIVRAAIF